MHRRHFISAMGSAAILTSLGTNPTDAKHFRRRRRCCTKPQHEIGQNIRSYMTTEKGASKEGAPDYGWDAAGSGIRHQRGEEHSNGQWWVDTVKESGLWTCYGPYINLEQGSWRAAWEFYIDVHNTEKPCFGFDVVAFVARQTIVAERIMRLGGNETTWDGRVVVDFDIGTDMDKVEVRMRPHYAAKLLIAKKLWIRNLR